MLSPDDAHARLRGVVVPTVTPFDEQGRLDLPAFRDLLAFVARQGASAVAPGDLVGEMFALTLRERRALLEAAVAACRGQMLVVALTAAASVEDAIELARYARDVDADVLKLSLPYPWTPTAAGMLDVFRRIDDAVQMPFLLESSDDLTIPVEVIDALCERPTFVGIEEFGSSASRADRIFCDFGERLVILTSGDNASLCLGLMGAPGMVVAESNFAPRQIAEFLEACRERKLDRALELFRARRRYRDLFRDELSRGLPMFVPYTKAALELMGLRVGRPRLPQEPLGERERQALRETLRSSFGIETLAP
jgi:4-hydroxy-tetrahydrodipicolinate synthase